MNLDKIVYAIIVYAAIQSNFFDVCSIWLYGYTFETSHIFMLFFLVIIIHFHLA